MAQLATAAIPLPLTDFSGGINTRDQPYLLDQSQARDLSNLQGTAAGALVKRTGCQTLATTSAAFTSLFALESTATSQLVGAAGTSLYSVSAAGTVTPIKTGLTSTASWEFASAPIASSQGPLYGMNGTDTPQQWSGSGSTGSWTATDSGGTVPNGKYCIYAQNQVFVTGVAANPSRVYWSGIADPTAWNPANLNGSGFMDFDPVDGEAITGIGTVGPYILVGKPSKLWVITNVATATARKVVSNVGITSHRSIVESREGTYFFGGDNVYVTNGSTVKTISALIIPTLAAIQPGQYSQICGGYFNSHYYLSIPLTGLTNDTTLDFDAQAELLVEAHLRVEPVRDLDAGRRAVPVLREIDRADRGAVLYEGRVAGQRPAVHLGVSRAVELAGVLPAQVVSDAVLQEAVQADPRRRVWDG